MLVVGTIDLANHLRAAGNTVPTVFISAFTEGHLRARAEEGGAIGFFAKPFDGQVLVKLLTSTVLA